jgi:hypothetical protein
VGTRGVTCHPTLFFGSTSVHSTCLQVNDIPNNLSA